MIFRRSRKLSNFFYCGVFRIRPSDLRYASWTSILREAFVGCFEIDGNWLWGMLLWFDHRFEVPCFGVKDEETVKQGASLGEISTVERVFFHVQWVSYLFSFMSLLLGSRRELQRLSKSRTIAIPWPLLYHRPTLTPVISPSRDPKCRWYERGHWTWWQYVVLCKHSYV
jgi:hypothetical protein